MEWIKVLCVDMSGATKGISRPEVGKVYSGYLTRRECGCPAWFIKDYSNAFIKPSYGTFWYCNECGTPLGKFVQLLYMPHRFTPLEDAALEAELREALMQTV